MLNHALSRFGTGRYKSTDLGLYGRTEIVSITIRRFVRVVAKGNYVGQTFITQHFSPRRKVVSDENIAGMDISAFFRAFFSDWVGWMSGLGSIALTLFGLFLPSANQKRAFYLAAAFFL